MNNKLRPVMNNHVFLSNNSFIHAWALKGLPYDKWGVYVYTIKLHGAFGEIPATYEIPIVESWDLVQAANNVRRTNCLVDVVMLCKS